MWTVDDLKVVCFDFDDTLCIHSERVDKVCLNIYVACMQITTIGRIQKQIYS